MEVRRRVAHVELRVSARGRARGRQRCPLVHRAGWGSGTLGPPPLSLGKCLLAAPSPPMSLPLCAFNFTAMIGSVGFLFLFSPVSPARFPSVVLQRSLHVEERQPAEAGRQLGTLDEIWLLLTNLWNWSSLPNTPVQQSNVGLGARWPFQSMGDGYRWRFKWHLHFRWSLPKFTFCSSPLKCGFCTGSQDRSWRIPEFPEESLWKTIPKI